jgi:Cys-rich protein (TIGR01571 family)
MGKVDEIKDGGINGCLGLDQIDWGGKGGKTYEFWKLEPCCGSPCNPKDAIICLAQWYCCSLCSTAKMFASSLGESKCAIIPHFLFAWLCAPCTPWFTRYNLRKKHGITGNLCGDAMCIIFCGPCATCQALRASSMSDWRLLPLTVACTVPEMKVIV